MKPPVVHRYPTWDLAKVLQALTEDPFEPLSWRFLTCKAAFLIALMSARWILELVALLVMQDRCIVHPERVVLHLDPSIPKVDSWFRRAQELILPDFCPEPKHTLEKKWHTLDKRRAFHIYIKRPHPSGDWRPYLSPSSPLPWAARSYQPPWDGGLGPVSPRPTSSRLFRCLGSLWSTNQKRGHNSAMGDTGLN